MVVEGGLQVARLFDDEHFVDEPEIGFGPYCIDDIAREYIAQVAVRVVVVPRPGVAAIGVENLHPVAQRRDGGLVVGFGLLAPTVAHHLRLRGGVVVGRIHRREGVAVGIVAQQDVDEPFGGHAGRIVGRLFVLADTVFRFRSGMVEVKGVDRGFVLDQVAAAAERFEREGGHQLGRHVEVSVAVPAGVAVLPFGKGLGVFFRHHQLCAL